MLPEQLRQASISFPANLLQQARTPRLRGETGTVLMIGARYYLQREVTRAFGALGWKVLTVNIEPRDNYIASLLEAIVFGKPDILFTVNHLGFDEAGMVARMIEQVELPVISWFVDSPAYIILNHPGAVSPWITTAVWERLEIDTLDNLGFSEPFWLPLATDPGLMGRGLGQKTDGIIGFVGDSMLESSERWRKMLPDGAHTDSLIDGSVHHILQDRRAHPLKEEIPAGWDEVTRLNFSSAVVLRATKLYRQKFLNFLTGKPLKIWGDNGWQQAAPSGAIVAGNVEYYRELPLVYGSTSVNLNFTSLQMPTAVNQRVFDVPAAGGFLLTDNQEDIALLFDSSEYASFSSVDEFTDKVDYYRQNPAVRESITRGARERIIKEHTYLHRVSRLISEMKRRYSPTIGSERKAG